MQGVNLGEPASLFEKKASKEVLYLFNEELQQVAVLDRYDSTWRFKNGHGWWLAGIKISEGVLSEPILFDLRHECKGVFTYKISPCPPQMAKKESFLEKVKKLSTSMFGK